MNYCYILLLHSMLCRSFTEVAKYTLLCLPMSYACVNSNLLQSTVFKCATKILMPNYLHVCVVYAHATEYGKSFEEVLVVLGEGQVVEFVDELHYTNDLACSVPDGHTQDGPVGETGHFVH